MARQCISEYSAKRILLGEGYAGIALSGSTDPLLQNSSAGTYVVKVDQGVKKRFHQGLLQTRVSKEEARVAIAKWEELGYTNFLLEPFIEHEEKDERYISFERVRDGIRVIFARDGGVNIESSDEIKKTFILNNEASQNILAEENIPLSFINHIQELMLHEYVSLIEINPLLITENGLVLLDAAVLVDDGGVFFTKVWNEKDIVLPKKKHAEEVSVTALQRSTAASLKLSVINPDGALFFLLSGGGGSIVILDAVHESGQGALIGNYGEYSGGPTREETYLYSKEVLSLLLKSKAPRKALVIAGGVANFTDIVQTFKGVTDALTEVAPRMRDAGIKVFVRRGGPNESAGLQGMTEFLTKEGLLGAVYGSDTIITKAAIEAVEYVTI